MVAVVLGLLAVTVGVAVAVTYESVGWGQSGDRPVGGDFDGNGTDDIAVFRNGEWHIRGQPPIPRIWGLAGDIPVPGDYDADGDTDIAIYRPSEGVWYVKDQPPYVQWGGQSGDIPVPADYDGDRDTDIAIYRASEGVWYVKGQPPFVQWGGQAGDIPVSGDYDADGDTDIAIYRPSEGVWYVKGQPPFVQWGGQAGDIPVPGDYDGDRDTDIAIYRPTNGVWYVKNQLPFQQWGGLAGDMPVPGDYAGDETTDIAVFRPSEGRWYVITGDDPVIASAGDLCSTPTDCAPSAAVVNTINPDRVLVLGDNAYPNGSASEYANFYAPNWGPFKSKTNPTPGNHEYQTAGAAGYFGYFSGVQPYYSFDLGAWHLISLNSEIAVNNGSAQENWLESDLAANAGKCILAYWHTPRWASSSVHASNSTYHQLWLDLYAAGADIVLNGHNHHYERFAKQNPFGVAAADGIRQFTVGTGGRGLYAFGTPIANSEVRNNTTFGVLRLTLHASSYDWQFMPVAGSTFTDAGTTSC